MNQHHSVQSSMRLVNIKLDITDEKRKISTHMTLTNDTRWTNDMSLPTAKMTNWQTDWHTDWINLSNSSFIPCFHEQMTQPTDWTKVAQISRRTKILKTKSEKETFPSWPISSFSEDRREKWNYVEGKSEFNFEIIYHTYDIIEVQLWKTMRPQLKVTFSTPTEIFHTFYTFSHPYHPLMYLHISSHLGNAKNMKPPWNASPSTITNTNSALY